jgi:hypothetical protein
MAKLGRAKEDLWNQSRVVLRGSSKSESTYQILFLGRLDKRNANPDL